MKLLAKQMLFSRLVVNLVDKAHLSGYEVTFGETYRSDEESARQGFPASLHRLRIAIDLNLFKNGVYLEKTSDHAELGEYWESLDTMCRWGGRFGDGNHYSLTHNGKS